MPATDYLRKKALDHFNGVATWAPPPNYLCLFKADPTEAGLQVQEVSGAGYARQPLAGVMGAADASGMAVNTSTISFGPAAADWGTSVYLATADTPSGGNIGWPGALNAPRTITTGQPFQIPAGALRMRIA